MGQSDILTAMLTDLGGKGSKWCKEQHELLSQDKWGAFQAGFCFSSREEMFFISDKTATNAACIPAVDSCFCHN